MEFCLIGAGFIGPVHAANIAAHPNARLRYVIDLNREAAERIATKYGARIAPSLDAALADPAVDAVVICTPPRNHAAIIDASAKAGKAIFCEKPIDLDLAKVDTCGETLRRTSVPFFVGFNRRFDPTHQALRAAIARGEIGRPEMIVLASRDPEISPPDYVKAMPYGIFYDTMIHDFDMVRWLTGQEPVEVYARTAVMLDEKVNPVRDPDTAMVVLAMADGALIHVNSSFRAVYGYDQRIEAFGSGGALLAANPPEHAVARWNGEGLLAAKPMDFFLARYADAYRAELDHFVRALESGRAPSLGLRDGRRALLLAEKALESVAGGPRSKCPADVSACPLDGEVRRR
jgi:myo-inositol 2-dehydrogenase/D-chiro-inositol 1-dehydrogenase